MLILPAAPTFLDLHIQKSILRNWSGVMSNNVPERVEVMATWVTHLMIADKVLEKISGLDRHGFCVGNIAPDCNVENEDWTSYTPSRAVTHRMSGERKAAWRTIWTGIRHPGILRRY